MIIPMLKVINACTPTETCFGMVEFIDSQTVYTFPFIQQVFLDFFKFK